ncbi:MAG: Na+/H+ antiporter subunit E [Candidatus Binatia bacterium]
MTLQKTGGLTLRFLLLYATWLVLSGRFQLKYLLLGVLSAGWVTFLTADLLHFEHKVKKREKSGLSLLLRSGWRLVLYFSWLIFAIIKANLQVAYLVCHPKLPIRPGLLRFKTQMQSGVGHIVLANSITLTPGTITVDFKEGTYLVHALVPEAAQSLVDAEMQNKLEAIFEGREDTNTEIKWVRPDKGLT